MENLKKNYKKLKYSGNENGWHEPIVPLSVTSITEAQADELNSHFDSTGIKYEETNEKPYSEAPLEIAGVELSSHAPMVEKMAEKYPKEKVKKATKQA